MVADGPGAVLGWVHLASPLTGIDIVPVNGGSTAGWALVGAALVAYQVRRAAPMT